METRELLASRMYSDEQVILPMPTAWEDMKSEPYRAKFLRYADWLLSSDDPNVKARLPEVLSDKWAYKALNLLDIARKEVADA